MSLKILKGLQVLVGICVVGIIGAFVMSIVTARKLPKVETQSNPAVIPVPATRQ